MNFISDRIRLGWNRLIITFSLLESKFINNFTNHHFNILLEALNDFIFIDSLRKFITPLFFELLNLKFGVHWYLKDATQKSSLFLFFCLFLKFAFLFFLLWILFLHFWAHHLKCIYLRFKLFLILFILNWNSSNEETTCRFWYRPLFLFWFFL